MRGYPLCPVGNPGLTVVCVLFPARGARKSGLAASRTFPSPPDEGLYGAPKPCAPTVGFCRDDRLGDHVRAYLGRHGKPRPTLQRDLLRSPRNGAGRVLCARAAEPHDANRQWEPPADCYGGRMVDCRCEQKRLPGHRSHSGVAGHHRHFLLAISSNTPVVKSTDRVGPSGRHFGDSQSIELPACLVPSALGRLSCTGR